MTFALVFGNSDQKLRYSQEEDRARACKREGRGANEMNLLKIQISVTARQARAGPMRHASCVMRIIRGG